MARSRFTKKEKADLKGWRKIAQDHIDWSHRVSPKFKEETRMRSQEYCFALVIIAMCDRLGIK
jgi:hypothetical protein